MDVFSHRISLDEAATIVQAAQERRFLDGATSVIFHHLSLMRSRIAALHALFPDRTLHALAIKANPVVEILREAVRSGAGLEAASIEEVHLALAAGCAADRVVFDSPAKTVAEIEQALRWGVYLNADNFAELERICEAVGGRGTKSVVGLRVNALVGGGRIAHTSVSQKHSKFGVSLDADRAKIIAAFAENDWLRGLHVHVGSQGCELPLLVEAAVRIAALRRDIAAATGRTVSHVDIGGGMSTAYRAGETATAPAEYAAQLRAQAPDLFGNDVQLVTEFGRAIQANCGLAVSRVEYVKPAQRLVVVHLGADFLLRPVYRPDDWRQEFFVLDAAGFPKGGAESPVTIAGPLCFGGDIVGREVSLSPIVPGDWMVIRDVGAYTLSMWSRHCSRGIPAVIGYDPQGAEPMRILRRGESADDVVRFWGVNGL